MLKPILVNAVSKKVSVNHLRISDHLKSSINLSITRYMASEAKTKWTGKNVLPVFSNHHDLARVKKAIYTSNELNRPDSPGGFAEDEEKIFDREFVEMKVEDFEDLYKNDATGSVKSKIENVLSEYEHHKYNSMGRVPAVITCADMERVVAEATSPLGIERMFNYLFKREMAKRGYSYKKLQDKASVSAKLDEKYAEMEKLYGENMRTGLLSRNGHLIYGLWHNSLFCRIPEGKLKLANADARLIEAALFGRQLVFDFDFEDHMAPQMCRSVLDQIQESYGLNRFHYQEPFDLWFCNFDKKSKSGRYLAEKSIKNLYNGSMITIKNDCFTNHFDKSRLVYLSPDAKLTLADSCNADDIFIVGVYNDKGSSKPLTCRKAEMLGIRSRSLPLDNFVAWQSGSKSLCLNHVTSILLEVMANGGDWREAMVKCIPSRKIKPIEIVMQEEERRLARRRKKFSIRSDFEF